MTTFDLSIVVLAKNEEKYIDACLQSITRSIPENIYAEIILVDNNSTDRTAEIAEKYEVCIVKSNATTIGRLRNVGAKHASGNIIGYIDADCIAPKQWSHNAIRLLSSGYDAVGGRCSLPYDANWVQSTWVPPKTLYDSMIHSNAFVGSTLFCKREAFIRVGGFDDSLTAGEDSDFSVRLISTGYNILITAACNVVHMGYPNTLKGFFNRQVWQTYGSYKGFSTFYNEKPIFLSMLFIFTILLACVFIFTHSFLYFLCFLSLGLIIPFGFTINRFQGSPLVFYLPNFPGGMLISIIYFAARFWGVFLRLFGASFKRSYK